MNDNTARMAESLALSRERLGKISERLPVSTDDDSPVILPVARRRMERARCIEDAVQRIQDWEASLGEVWVSIQPKVNGMNLGLEYKVHNGQAELQRMTTRGRNGTVGKDVSRHIKRLFQDRHGSEGWRKNRVVSSKGFVKQMPYLSAQDGHTFSIIGEGYSNSVSQPKVAGALNGFGWRNLVRADIRFVAFGTDDSGDLSWDTHVEWVPKIALLRASERKEVLIDTIAQSLECSGDYGFPVDGGKAVICRIVDDHKIAELKPRETHQNGVFKLKG